MAAQVAKLALDHADGGEDKGELRALAWAASADPVARGCPVFIDFGRLVGMGSLGVGDVSLLAAKVAATGSSLTAADKRLLDAGPTSRASPGRTLRLSQSQAEARRLVEDWVFSDGELSQDTHSQVMSAASTRSLSSGASLTLPAVAILAARRLIAEVLLANRVRSTGEIVIHFLGAVERRTAEGDMDLSWLRSALARLLDLPDLRLVAVLVGFLGAAPDGAEALAQSYAQKSAGWPGVEVTCRKGLFHDVVGGLPQPDLCVLGNAGFEAHFLQWAPTIALLRDSNVPMAVSGYTKVGGALSHDAPASLDAASVLSVQVLQAPSRNLVAGRLPDEGRCYCGRSLRPASADGIASSGCWLLLRGRAENGVGPPRSPEELEAAWRSFRFKFLRRVAYEERVEGHYDAMASVATFLDAVDAGEEVLNPEDGLKELVLRAMKRPMNVAKAGLEGPDGQDPCHNAEALEA
ncbi:unnamed protein product [Polarella glacialis]|uniref:Mitochondrial splicing suppressor 51-like C-terminal domain-containing protein n=1 Tax=Polarella glacialis TaxID=89957 RepID=A0A813LGX1_POLGL|nr:unnamed protein product [Polarella glacialis]CAE8727424.1 unnamed protein product [Polarella glacialis]